MQRCCNLGYARRECERAASHEADAVRFLIRGVADETAEVAWSSERDHHPVAAGTLHIPLTGDAEDASETIEMQARAYVAGYVRHSGRVA